MTKYQGIVFFDLDGTLLNSKKEILPSSLRAIKKMKENRVLPVIVTGRSLAQIKDIMQETGIDTVVCNNGAFVQYQGRDLLKETIDTNLIVEMIKMVRQNHDAISLMSKNKIGMIGENDLSLASRRRYPLPKGYDNDFYQHHQVLFMDLYTHDDEKYHRAFDSRLFLVRNGPLCIDITKKGVDKSTGIPNLLHKLHLIGIPTYAFGDGTNDLGMLHKSKYGVAMGNGEKAAKAGADFVTTDCDHDGIANGLKHYHLI